MARYDAFLASISVGASQLTMTGLRNAFEGEGIANDGTLVVSGNGHFGHDRAAVPELGAGFARLRKEHEGPGDERMATGTRARHIDFAGRAPGSRRISDFIARRPGCRGTARNLRSVKRIQEQMD
jgi:uncharacterized protein (DUF1697 family)